MGDSAIARSASKLGALEREHQRAHQHEGQQHDAELERGQVQAASESDSSDTVPAGKRRFSAPKMPCMVLLIAMPTPMVAIIGIRCGAPPRSGLSTRKSIAEPAAEQEGEQQPGPSGSANARSPAAQRGRRP